MHLKNGEEIMHTFRRHKTPFFIRLVLILIISIPVFIVVYFIGTAVSSGTQAIMYALTSFMLGIVLSLYALNYLLDKLVVTNQRVIFEDWKNIFTRLQHEAKFEDIQDIRTREKGFLSGFKFLDYGSINIETSASRTSVVYEDCPDPEGVKHVIYEELGKARELGM